MAGTMTKKVIARVVMLGGLSDCSLRRLFCERLNESAKIADVITVNVKDCKTVRAVRMCDNSRLSDEMRTNKTHGGIPVPVCCVCAL